MFSLIGKIIALGAAAVIGLVEGALFFSDPGPGETLALRLAVSVPLAVAGGALWGYNFRRLWFLSIACAWSPVMFFLFGLADLNFEPARLRELGELLTPVAAALAGGWFGAKLKAVKNLVLLLAAGALAVAGARIYLERLGG